MRVLISGGGTGGHVYPALAVAEQLNQAAARRLGSNQTTGHPDQSRRVSANQPQGQGGSQPHANGGAVHGEFRPAERDTDQAVEVDVEVLWVGSIGGMEQALVTQAGIAYQGIRTGQIRGINPLKALSNAGRMAKGVQESLGIVRSFAPDVCLVTGGYVCAPVALACRMRGVPVMIYLPDMLPGASIRSLSRLADRVAVSFPDVASFFGGEAPEGKAVVTGYPVRQELVEAASDRAASRLRLAKLLDQPLDGTASDRNNDGGEPKLVLIWGGSQGSRNINESVWKALPVLLPHAHIVHVVGERDWPLYEEQADTNPLDAYAERYHPVAYLHKAMPLALAAADITVARAGASSLGEFPVAHLPSILVPLPFAGVGQQANADLLVGLDAAIVIEDEDLLEQLTPQLVALLEDDARRLQMEEAAAALARPDAALAIAQALIDLQKADSVVALSQ